MDKSKNNRARRRPGKHTFTTKTGNTVKLHRSLMDRWRAGREAKARRRAAFLSTLPKNRFKRVLYRLHPKRLAQYWFSRDGAIMALKVTGISIVVIFFTVVGLFAYFRKDLPNITDLSGDLGGTVSYYDRTGDVLLYQDSEAVKRTPVGGKVAKTLKDATVAIEDKDYYKHGAFDLRGIVRAGFNDVFKRSGGVQGGSTISQQVVKLNQDWAGDRTIARKVKELILAVELEREYSKEDILNGYLDIAPYGGILYGAESAAQSYFGIAATELSLAQSALLAGIPKSPTFYSPYLAVEDQETREALIGRQQYILDQMVDQKMITKEQADEAKAVDILAQIKPRQTKYENVKAPYFVLAAKEELEERYTADTVMRSGWKVTTTLDMNLQKIADEQVQKGLKQVQNQRGDNIAFGAMDVKTGQMVALVGGVDFNNKDFGQNNYAAGVKLPPGSSFKPYDYMAMIEYTTNTGAGSVLYDEKDPLPGYPCTVKDQLPPPKGKGNCLHDYDFKFPGPVTLRYGLAGSRNVPAVKAMLSVVPGNTTASVNKTIEMAQSMGIKSGYKCYDDEKNTVEAQCYGAAAIGDGAFLRLDEHVNGYATMARLGNYLPKTYILKITDEKGKVIDEWKQPKGEQVIRQDSAYIVADILSDPRASYMSRKAQEFKNAQGKIWKFALKTGTTNDNKDGWMMGTSTQYAAGVWVGHHTRQVEMRPFMETMTQPIWQGWMQAAHNNLEPVNWQRPATIKSLAAFILRSHVGNSSIEPSPEQDIFPAWYQPPNKSTGQQTFDKVSNKIATSCTPELAKEEKSGGNAEAFSADPFHGSGPSTTTDTDDVHFCTDTKPSITLTSPTTCSSQADCVFIITVSQGTHALSSDRFAGTVNFLVNGQRADSVNVSTSPATVTFTYNPTASATATIEAQVIDSALYSSSQSATVNFTPTPAPTTP